MYLFTSWLLSCWPQPYCFGPGFLAENSPGLHPACQRVDRWSGHMFSELTYWVIKLSGQGGGGRDYWNHCICVPNCVSGFLNLSAFRTVVADVKIFCFLRMPHLQMIATTGSDICSMQWPWRTRTQRRSQLIGGKNNGGRNKASRSLFSFWHSCPKIGDFCCCLHLRPVAEVGVCVCEETRGKGKLMEPQCLMVILTSQLPPQCILPTGRRVLGSSKSCWHSRGFCCVAPGLVSAMPGLPKLWACVYFVCIKARRVNDQHEKSYRVRPVQ